MLLNCTSVVRDSQEGSLQALHCNLRECEATLELLFGRSFDQWSIRRRKCTSRPNSKQLHRNRPRLYSLSPKLRKVSLPLSSTSVLPVHSRCFLFCRFGFVVLRIENLGSPPFQILSPVTPARLPPSVHSLVNYTTHRHCQSEFTIPIRSTFE
jgi:hypothetical protein